MATKSLNSKSLPSFNYEIEYWKTYNLIAGVDEVGRGCLAGPVTACAIIFPSNSCFLSKINDSKLLNEKQRNELAIFIKENALAYSISSVDVETIENINILNASIKAMNISINNLSKSPEFLLIDGNRFTCDSNIPFITIVKGDSKSVSIAASSILAKVERDKFISEIAHTEYPMYHFDKNKGYGTSEHIEAIKKYGISPYHRKSFLKNILNNQISMFS